ncbi:MAG TPA: protein kinase, partial [Terriglobales bacterium]|nr:protein kinase [Terriglobales bacterium]
MISRALDQSLLIGHSLGHCRIVEKIGAGGMGEVYRGRDEHLDRDVAIKVLPPRTFSDESARRHFHQEALALSRLNHPNIASVYDFDTEDGIDFLVMEYVPGVTLDTKRSERLKEKDIAQLGT